MSAAPPQTLADVAPAAAAPSAGQYVTATGKPRFVIDTNVVLDLWLYADPHTELLRRALGARALDWLATARMREELARVLNYPHIAARLLKDATTAGALLAQFDAHARSVPAPAKVTVTCKDPDDQCFIDLAVVHQAACISKDKAVLTMARRLERLGAHAAKPQGFAAQLQAAIDAAAGSTVTVATSATSAAVFARAAATVVVRANDSAVASAQ